MNAEEVARQTKELLDKQGYVIWKCSELNGEKITIVNSKLNGCFPAKYQVYTIRELIKLCSNENVRVVFELNKLGVEAEEEL